MANSHSDLWAGSVHKARFVFDPDVQVDGSRYILIFLTQNEKLIPFLRSHLRAHTQPLSASHPERESYFDLYWKWRARVSDKDLEKIHYETKIKDEELEAKYQDIRKSHQEFVQSQGIEYLGAEDPSNKSLRLSHCWQCRSDVKSDIHLSCCACHWLICGLCGTCGCGYEMGSNNSLKPKPLRGSA